MSVLLGSGREGQLDGTQQSCTYSGFIPIQVQGICLVEKTLLVTDVAAGKIKIVSGLSGTGKFLKMLVSFFATFGAHNGQRTINKENKARASETKCYRDT